MNTFKTQIKLSKVKDAKQHFKLKSRNESPVYTVQKKGPVLVIISSVSSGRTYSKKPGLTVFIKGKPSNNCRKK